MKVWYWPPGSNWRTAACTVSEFELEEMERSLREFEQWSKATMASWFYISFASAERGHLGSTVVEAENTAGAIEVAAAHGLNPGGEAEIIPIPDAKADLPELIPLRYRLASKAELLATGKFGSIRDVAAADRPKSVHVCEQCNNDVPHKH